MINKLLIGAVIITFMVMGALSIVIFKEITLNKEQKMTTQALPQQNKRTENTDQPLQTNPTSGVVTNDVLSQYNNQSETTPISTTTIDFIKANASSVDTIQITKCTPDPYLLRTTGKKTISVKNNDAIPHVLVFGRNYIFNIAANNTTSLSLDFIKQRGVFGFACDTSAAAVGLFVNL